MTRGLCRGVGWAQHFALDGHDILPRCGITGGRPRLNAALLPCFVVFVFFSSLWLVNRDYTQKAEPGSHTEWPSMWLSDKKHPSFLFFTASHFPLLHFISSSVYCTQGLLSSRAASLGILYQWPSWDEKGQTWISLCFECLQPPDFTKTQRTYSMCWRNEIRRLSCQEFLWLHSQGSWSLLVCLLLRINFSCWFTDWVNWFKH